MSDPIYYRLDEGGGSVTTVHPLPTTGVNASGAPSASAAPPPSTGTFTQVASGPASVTILAANPARLGAAINNTDTNTLFLRLASGAATTTAFTQQLAANQSYEVPFGYTGIISGIWAADGAGNANVTEFTA